MTFLFIAAIVLCDSRRLWHVQTTPGWQEQKAGPGHAMEKGDRHVLTDILMSTAPRVAALMSPSTKMALADARTMTFLSILNTYNT